MANLITTTHQSPIVNFFTNKIVYCLIFLNLLITIPLAAYLNIWRDEAYALQTSSKNLLYALHQAVHFEMQPPLYFLLLNIWRSVNGSFFWARLFSILSISLTIYLTAALAKRWLPQMHPGWLTICVAFNPFTIWAAIEIRVYALVILIATLLLLFFFDGYLKEKVDKKARYFYVILSICGLYTQYFIGFLLVANGAALLITKRWRNLLNYCLAMVIVGICFAPMLIFVPDQVASNTYGGVSSSLVDGVKYIFNSMLRFTLPMPWGTIPILRILRFVVATLLIFIVVKYCRFISQLNLTIWTITFVLASFFALALDLTDALLLRHAAVIFLPAILSAFTIISLIKTKHYHKVLSTWVAIILTISTISLYFNYKPLAKEIDWPRITNYITAAEQPNQPILVFPTGIVLPLQYYYSGINSLIPIPEATELHTFQRYNVNDFPLKDTQEITQILENKHGNHDYLWLVKWRTCNSDYDVFNCQVLEEFINEFYVPKSSKIFYQDTEVIFLQRKEN